MCVRVGVPTSSCSRNPGSASSPCRAGPKMATWFSVASPSSTGDPFLSGLGCWQLCQAVAGMEFPVFLVGRVASESYLLCLWHQLASWSCGRVRETRAGTRGLLLGASSWLTCFSPLSLWAQLALSRHKAVLEHPAGRLGSFRPQILRCPGHPYLSPVVTDRKARGPGRQAQPRSCHAVPSTQA